MKTIEDLLDEKSFKLLTDKYGTHDGTGAFFGEREAFQYGFRDGFELAQKELEEQLKESREVIEALAECKYPVDPNSDCDMLIDEAKAYLEKWK